MCVGVVEGLKKRLKRVKRGVCVWEWLKEWRGVEESKEGRVCVSG